MLQEEAILLQNQDSYRLPQYIENPRYGPAEWSGVSAAAAPSFAAQSH